MRKKKKSNELFLHLISGVCILVMLLFVIFLEDRVSFLEDEISALKSKIGDNALKAKLADAYESQKKAAGAQIVKDFPDLKTGKTKEHKSLSFIEGFYCSDNYKDYSIVEFAKDGFMYIWSYENKENYREGFSRDRNVAHTRGTYLLDGNILFTEYGDGQDKVRMRGYIQGVDTKSFIKQIQLGVFYFDYSKCPEAFQSLH